jgi:hypothetical protein
MVFDACEEKIRQVVIKAAIELRKARGQSEERNITILFREAASLLGVFVDNLSSAQADHLPSPGEMKNEKKQFVIPRKDCPRCRGTMVLGSICQSCKDAEGGKYKSGYKCEMCQFVDDKSEKFFTQRLVELGIDVPNGMKQAMEIKTITDEGFI